jgi:hypothetical protein
MKKEQVQRAMEAGRAAAQQAREELERRIADTKAAYQTAGDGGIVPQVSPTRRTAAAAAVPLADEEPEKT